MSCMIGDDGNFNDFVLNNSNHLASTIDTTSHSYTVFENITNQSTQCLYCDFVANGSVLTNASLSGCLLVFGNFSNAAPPVANESTALSPESCPTTLPAVGVLFLLFAIAGFLIFLGLHASVMGVLGGLMVFVLSWLVAPCYGIFGILCLVSGILIMAYFGSLMVKGR